MLTETLQGELLGRAPVGYGGRFYGVYPAVVTGLYDENHKTEVQVKLPWCPDTDSGGLPLTVWARVAVPMAGNSRGHWFYPDVDDEVLVCFEAGDARRPYIIGALWNGKDAGPETMDQDGKNNIKSITTRTGIKITLDDTDKKQLVEIKTPGGHKITLQDDGENSKPFVKIEDSNTNTLTLNEKGIEGKDKNGNTVTLNEDGITVADKNQNKAVLDTSGIKLTDKSQSQIEMASGNVTVKNSAGQSVTVNATAVEVKDVGGDKVTVGPAGIKIVDVSTVNSIEVGPSGVKLQATPASMVSMNPGGITLQAGATILKLGPDGIMMTGPTVKAIGMGQVQVMAPQVQMMCAGQFQVIAPQAMLTAAMINATTAMLQVAGVVQCATLIAPAVTAGAYTPGGGNIL
jgi:phage baseplate assembly protein gpV